MKNIITQLPIVKSALFRLVFSLLIFFPGSHLSAQHLDEIQFGNNSSESHHGLTSFNPQKSQVFTGFNGQTARLFSPDPSNPMNGELNIYGGEISFVLKVDGTRQNYFTAKLSGEDVTSNCRILLIVDGKEIGSRHGSDEEYFIEGSTDKKSPNSFYFRTAPIPRTLTDGKTEVVVKLRSTGNYYAYGTTWVYTTYQREMTKNTIGIYKLFSHTDPGFALPENEIGGVLPSYATATSNAAINLASFKATTVSNANSYFSGVLKGNDYIATDGNNYFNPIEALAGAYFQPEITAIYQNPTVIDKLYKLIDNLAINHFNGNQTATGAWGGAFGRPGYAVFLLYDKLDQSKLDEIVNLGGGTNRTRRSQWCEIFKASFNAGAGSRKSITNQEMECDVSVYGASLALVKLDSITYSTYPTIGLRMGRECCGLDEFTGAATNLNTTKPQLGNPANSSKGSGYYYVTKKGTSHEPGWVSTDCYGNLGHQFVHLYEMSKQHLGGNGDPQFLERGVLHAKSQSAMTYAFVGDDGKKDILAEGFVCWRNTYVPGKSFYTNPYLAGVSKDETLLGYIRQMIQDGRLYAPGTNDFRMIGTKYYFDLLDALQASTSNVRLPSSPDQPNYFSADEENGIVTIKNANEQLFFNMYYRDYADNRIVKLHDITPNYQRMAEMRPLTTEFVASGKTKTRDGSVQSVTSGTPPDNPESAYKGQVESIPYSPDANSTDRCLKDYYLVRYGRYLIAMNTTSSKNKIILFPADMVGRSAYEFSAKTTAVLPESSLLPPMTTKVFCLNDYYLTPGMIGTSGDSVSTAKNALIIRVSELDQFIANPTTVSNVAVVPTAGKYKHTLFNLLVQKLTTAKYVSVNPEFNQAEVDKALNELNAAYSSLVAGIYKFSVNQLEDGLYTIRKAESSLYLTNKKTSQTPLIEAMNTDKTVQLWQFQKDGERYKVTSKFDGRYLNENATFGTNAYSVAWNTMNIYYDGVNYAIQKGGSAGSGYWRINVSQISSDGTGDANSLPLTFPFKIERYYTGKLDSVLVLANAFMSTATSSDFGELGTIPTLNYNSFQSTLNEMIAAYDTVSSEVSGNAMSKTLNDALISVKKSMINAKNILTDGIYYIKAGSYYYTAPYGFSTFLGSDTLLQWKITKKYVGYIFQNLKTGLYWNQNAYTIKTQAQIDVEGNANRFALYFNGNKYAINSLASGFNTHYLNTKVNVGLSFEVNDFPDPMHYFFEIISVTTTAINKTGISKIECYMLNKKLVINGVEQGTPVSVYDFSGRLIISYSVGVNQEVFNFPAGIYLVVLNQKTKSNTYKVLSY